MKALRCRAWGAPDTLQLEEAESPKLLPHQVRIRVRAAGVNFADTFGPQGLCRPAPFLGLAASISIVPVPVHFLSGSDLFETFYG
jgi:NADPH2:quinone reductase